MSVALSVRRIAAALAGVAFALLAQVITPAPAQASTTAVSYLPFDFSYNVSTSMWSRTFYPSSTGRVCITMRAKGGNDPAWHTKTLKVDVWQYGLPRGPQFSYSAWGGYVANCWYGLSQTSSTQFRIVNPTGSAIWGDGWAQP